MKIQVIFHRGRSKKKCVGSSISQFICMQICKVGCFGVVSGVVLIECLVDETAERHSPCLCVG